MDCQVKGTGVKSIDDLLGNMKVILNITITSFVLFNGSISFPCRRSIQLPKERSRTMEEGFMQSGAILATRRQRRILPQHTAL